MKSNALRFLLATLTDLDIDDDRSDVFDAETKGVVIGAILNSPPLVSPASCLLHSL